jgi:hypothetical protein
MEIDIERSWQACLVSLQGTGTSKIGNKRRKITSQAMAEMTMEALDAIRRVLPRVGDTEAQAS